MEKTTIEAIQNVWLTLTLISLGIYLLVLLIESKPHWFLSKSYLKCKQFEDKYQKKLVSRRELLHHYYWAKSNDESKNMKEIEANVINMDIQLKEMRQMYGKVKKGLPIPLKII